MKIGFKRKSTSSDASIVPEIKSDYRFDSRSSEGDSTGTVKKLVNCRICGSPHLVRVLDLGDQVLTGYFPLPDEGRPISGQLDLVLCDPTQENACGLLQLGHSIPLPMMYGENYGYRSSNNNSMKLHLRQTIDGLVKLADPQPQDWVLDIGSNDGTTLSFYEGLSLNRVGMDPSAKRFESDYPNGSQLIVDFFSEENLEKVIGRKKYKIITSIAMFYDLEEPSAFMRQIAALLDKDGVWHFEQSYMPEMISQLAYDSICHEHYCYYGMKQIVWMIKRNGLKIVDVKFNGVNGGSFSVTAALDGSKYCSCDELVNGIVQDEKYKGFEEIDVYRRFASRVAAHRDEIREFILRANDDGKRLYAYGASTKGNVLLQYMGISKKNIPMIADKYSWKIGRTTPGTGIPIVEEDVVRQKTTDYLLVLPWYFRDEIVEREKPFIENGGALIFPFPRLEVVRKRQLMEKATLSATTNKDVKVIPWAKPKLFGNELRYIASALDSTYLSDGQYVSKFERDFGAYFGYKERHVVSVNNGTSALELALLSIGIRRDDEVIVPGWGFAAAANMVMAVGANPIFADIDENGWLIDLADAERKITEKTKAIIVINTYGNIADYKKLVKLSRNYGIFLIEDCAESLFSSWIREEEKIAGDIATFSFQSTKTITSGEGGAVLFRDIEFAERARLLRNHGMKVEKKYWHEVVGRNYRLTNVQAAMLCAQWENIDAIVQKRIAVRRWYMERLSSIKGIIFQEIRDDIFYVPWAMPIRITGNQGVERRDEVLRALSLEKIECRPAFYALSQQPIYGAKTLPVSEGIANSVLTLPLFHEISPEDVAYICEKVASKINGRSRI